MFGFVLGAIVGSVAAYRWHEKIRQYMQHDVSTLRDRAADRLGHFGERASGALDRARSSLESTIKAGQEKLRATGTSGTTGPRT
jgi:ElaB/YqjD/DUF883 family membrane-anchored ribosome-binding protein